MNYDAIIIGADLAATASNAVSWQRGRVFSNVVIPPTRESRESANRDKQRDAKPF
jgi:hypothetical protein